MKSIFKNFVVSAMIGGLTILGSSCGGSSEDFNTFSQTGGNALVEVESTNFAGQYSGEVVLNDGRVITSGFTIDGSGNVDGSFTIAAFGAAKAPSNNFGGISSQAAVDDDTATQPVNGGRHIPSGTYALEGIVDEDGLAASGEILRNGVDRGLFFVDLTSGLTRFRFDCSRDPVTGLSPCPSEEDIQYFLDHLRIGTHGGPGRGR